MGRIKREIALKVAAEAITNMSDADARKFLEMLDVGLWDLDLHKEPKYPLFQIIFRTSNPQNADICKKYLILCNKWEKQRVLIRPFLKKLVPMMPYSTKQKKADIVLRMVNVADAKRGDWKKDLNDLADRFRNVKE